MQQEGILRDLGVRCDQVCELWNTLSELHTHAYVYVYIYIYMNYDVTFFFDFRRVSCLADHLL
jgi:hypothetical protein